MRYFPIFFQAITAWWTIHHDDDKSYSVSIVEWNCKKKFCQVASSHIHLTNIENRETISNEYLKQEKSS